MVEPGRIYPTGDPEGSGRIPVRTELTVLSADDPKSPTLEFKVTERNGGAVTRIDDKGQTIEKPVKSEDGLKPGNLLIAPTLIGEVRAVVAVDGVGDLCWVSGGMVGDLEYDKERGYWITTLAINKKLLT
jgi:hypothetical protein